MKRIYKNLIVALFLFIETITHAQTPDFTDDVQDVPINDWILPMALIGVGLALYCLKKKQALVK